MIKLSVNTDIAATPWIDCKGLGSLASITRIGRLTDGTESGKSTVTILIEYEDGSRHMAQTTLSLFLAAADVLKAADEQPPAPAFDPRKN